MTRRKSNSSRGCSIILTVPYHRAREYESMNGVKLVSITRYTAFLCTSRDLVGWPLSGSLFLLASFYSLYLSLSLYYSWFFYCYCLVVATTARLQLYYLCWLLLRMHRMCMFSGSQVFIHWESWSLRPVMVHPPPPGSGKDLDACVDQDEGQLLDH